MIRDVIMLGGGKRVKKAIVTGTLSISIIGFLIGLFLLRAYIVQLTYNAVAPRLISNMSDQTHQFKPLNFQEALMFTLLVTFLIS